jgi:threonine synthase
MDETGCILQPADLDTLRRDIYSISVSDQETRQTVVEAWKKKKLLLEPHGAVAWKGYESWITECPEDADLPAVVLETAHPAKFHEEMKKLLGFEPQVPSALAQLNPSKETYSQMLADFSCLKEFLLSKASG